MVYVLWIHTSKWTQTKEDFDFISHVLFVKKYIWSKYSKVLTLVKSGMWFMPHFKISWSFSVLLKIFYVFKQLLRKLMKSSNTSFRSTPLHIYVVKVNYMWKIFIMPAFINILGKMYIRKNNRSGIFFSFFK